MTSIKKSIILACAASVLSFGIAMAQTDPNAAAPAAPAAGAAPADPAPMASDDQGAMPKKKMAKKKHMSKKAMKKKMM